MTAQDEIKAGLNEAGEILDIYNGGGLSPFEPVEITIEGYRAALISVAGAIGGISMDALRENAKSGNPHPLFPDETSRVWMGLMKMSEIFKNDVDDAKLLPYAEHTICHAVDELRGLIADPPSGVSDIHDAIGDSWDIAVTALLSLAEAGFPDVGETPHLDLRDEAAMDWPEAPDNEMDPHIPAAEERLTWGELANEWPLNNDPAQPLFRAQGADGTIVNITEREWVRRTLAHAERLTLARNGDPDLLARTPRFVMYPFYAQILALTEKLWRSIGEYHTCTLGHFKGSKMIFDHIIRNAIPKQMLRLAEFAPRAYFQNETGHHARILLNVNRLFHDALDALPKSIHGNSIAALAKYINHGWVAYSKFCWSLRNEPRLTRKEYRDEKQREINNFIEAFQNVQDELVGIEAQMTSEEMPTADANAELHKRFDTLETKMDNADHHLNKIDHHVKEGITAITTVNKRTRVMQKEARSHYAEVDDVDHGTENKRPGRRMSTPNQQMIARAMAAYKRLVRQGTESAIKPWATNYYLNHEKAEFKTASTFYMAFLKAWHDDRRKANLAPNG